uniref:Uncharacterized protein n=1 Tax=Candidatus Kentrum sp. TC TaxID=2126339 RepID=A0A450ZWZ5_9GAMM|nr:MAG: hypothetical protein BECKTC1821F_GA0114240_102333 [Candidatus Kentron sp. TC]
MIIESVRDWENTREPDIRCASHGADSLLRIQESEHRVFRFRNRKRWTFPLVYQSRPLLR